MPITTEILTVGDELLRGDLNDTNSTWLAARLFGMGIPVRRIVSLGDDLEPLSGAIEQAIHRGGLVVITGGLGPTDDDRTTCAVARAAKVPLELSNTTLETLRARFASAGYPFTPNNEKQARFPRGAMEIKNSRGTAPGFLLRVGDARVVCLPGVPSEMKAMFDDGVVPLLAQDEAHPAAVRVVRTFGVGESQIDHRLQGLLEAIDADPSEVSLHYRTSFPENQVLLVVRGVADPGATLERFEEEVRRRLSPYVFGVGDVSFSDAVVGALKEAGAKVALAESCTGGLAGDLVTRASGSSSVFELGVVTYSNACKHRMLGVPEEVLEQYGAVSSQCVEAMARGVRDLAKSTYGVAISGVAGPTGGTPEKPVGTVWFGLAHPDGVSHLVRRFPWVHDRQRIKQASAHVALYLVLAHLRDGTDPFEGRWEPGKGGRS
jgi:nicotinamide-nucleotide amidase